jgi:hypothetical protein
MLTNPLAVSNSPITDRIPARLIKSGGQECPPYTDGCSLSYGRHNSNTLAIEIGIQRYIMLSVPPKSNPAGKRKI